jgi:murein DD-endopeptidase MepM/ murein hydrolase activator NlpD
MIKAPVHGPDGRTPPAPLLRAGLSRLAVLVVVGGLAGCSSLSLPGGFDLINDTSESDVGRQPTAPRPEPDARGVISYPTYQVAVAREGDTVAAMAGRLGVGPEALADANGLNVTGNLRAGELLLLPSRVATTAPTGSLAAGGAVDVATLAGSALDRAEGQSGSTGSPAAAPAPTGTEPRRHTVERGETAFSIARLYSVSARAIGDWNGLNSALDVREGQVLLIPVATGPAPDATGTSAPGTGSVAPEPPSAAAPQPAENLPSVAGAAAGAAVVTPSTPPAPQTQASDTTRLLQPVSGQIIRGYNPGRNEGVDFGTAPGAPVRAADAGTVAAITRDTEQVQIIVLRHANGVLTVYANVDDIVVEKGTSVARGQRIASVNAADPSFLHFEVLQGSQRVDPVPFLSQ